MKNQELDIRRITSIIKARILKNTTKRNRVLPSLASTSTFLLTYDKENKDIKIQVVRETWRSKKYDPEYFSARELSIIHDGIIKGQIMYVKRRNKDETDTA